MNKTTSRRQFLKLAGGAAALTGLAQIVGCDGIKTNYVTNTIQPPQCADAVDFSLNQNQQMGDERETLTKYDLSDMLKSSLVATVPGATQMNQYLRFGNPSNGMTFNPNTGAVIYGQNEFGQTGNFLFFKDGDGIFEHELEFENGLESVVDANGNLTTLVGQTLPILGKDYRVLTARRTVNALDLGLMAGAFKSQQAGFGPQTYVLNDKEYEVFVRSIDANNNTEYQINGEITPVMQPGQLYKLADGTMFGHVKSTGASPATMVADFALDADGLWLSDDDTTDGKSLPFITRNNEIITTAQVKMLGAPLLNGNFELSDIRYRLQGDFKVGDGYIGPGQKLSQQLAQPAGILGKGFDIEYEGMLPNSKHLVRVCSK